VRVHGHYSRSMPIIESSLMRVRAEIKFATSWRPLQPATVISSRYEVGEILTWRFTIAQQGRSDPHRDIYWPSIAGRCRSHYECRRSRQRLRNRTSSCVTEAHFAQCVMSDWPTTVGSSSPSSACVTPSPRGLRGCPASRDAITTSALCQRTFE
jgi:hypothetical protein